MQRREWKLTVMGIVRTAHQSVETYCSITKALLLKHKQSRCRIRDVALKQNVLLGLISSSVADEIRSVLRGGTNVYPVWLKEFVNLTARVVCIPKAPIASHVLYTSSRSRARPPKV